MIGLSHAVIVLGILLCLFLLVCVLPIQRASKEDSALEEQWLEVLDDIDFALWENEVKRP